VKNCNFHSNCFTRQCGCIIKVHGYIVYRWIQRSVRIKQLQEFLKSDHWLRRYCILSGGIFYFEPPCRLGLKVSSTKTEVQSIGRKKQKIRFRNSDLTQCEQFVYLGGVIQRISVVIKMWPEELA